MAQPKVKLMARVSIALSCVRSGKPEHFIEPPARVQQTVVCRPPEGMSSDPVDSTTWEDLEEALLEPALLSTLE
jgi:hypothetical protein